MLFRQPLLGGLMLLMVGGCASQVTPDREKPIVDQNFLTQQRWDDGQAEIAFYEVRRTRHVPQARDSLQFTVGTYLVKQAFNPQKLTKATTGGEAHTPAFKYAFFYEFASGSYQYKRNYVVNSHQATLRPLKASFTSFDWCSNQYRELAFQDGEGRLLKRSDDYGNARRSFEVRARAFTMAQLPLLVRSLDFHETRNRSFWIVTPKGKFVRAEAEHAGRDTLALPMGRAAAERIVVRYEKPAPSMLAGKTGRRETYWRGEGPGRLLLKMQGDGYRMHIKEHLRSPYWKENVYDRLQRVSERP